MGAAGGQFAVATLTFTDRYFCDTANPWLGVMFDERGQLFVCLTDLSTCWLLGCRDVIWVCLSGGAQVVVMVPCMHVVHGWTAYVRVRYSSGWLLWHSCRGCMR